ncbi:MAG: hypothetical protein ACJZ59_01295 [Candidatus Thalassarchaeaceae archaeon]|nr:MAG: hypothetical protein CBE15_00190 [Euryarchaeota archaeon TMED255]RAH08687.1 MAG: hypothetical protein CMA23_006725 [Euryarchaeota archaeon]
MADRLHSILDGDRDAKSRILTVPGISMFLMLTIIGSNILFLGRLSIPAILILCITCEIGLRWVMMKAGCSIQIPEWEFSNDDYWVLAIAVTGTFALMAPHLLFREPLGIDWIGFASIAEAYASIGTATMVGPTDGGWLYPPAVPGTAAALMVITGIESHRAISLLGHLGIALLCAGLAGIMGRNRASGAMLVAIVLGAGIFAKSLDSGHPTILSLLPLIPLLMLVLKPRENRNELWLLIAFFSIASAFTIHPTGGIYAVLLLLADQVHESVFKTKEIRVLFGWTIAIGLGWIIVNEILNGLVTGPITAEYGWQGGSHLLRWNMPLLLVALWGFKRGYQSMEARTLMAWFILLWLSSFIHLLNGLEGSTFLTVNALILYSMAMHGFHIPLACLAAFAISPNPNGWFQRPDTMEIAPLPNPISPQILHTCFAIGGVLLLFTLAWFGSLANHPELWARTEGDAELQSSLDLPEGSIVYVENRPWGHVIGIEAGIQRTAHPHVGITLVEESIQNMVHNSIVWDDADRIAELGVTHAISSPRGEIGFHLAESNHWSIDQEIDGSRLWSFHSEPTTESTLSHTIHPINSISCNDGCEWRLSPWTNLYPWRTTTVVEERAFLTNGGVDEVIEIAESFNSDLAQITVVLEANPGVIITLEVDVGGNSSTVRQTMEGRLTTVTTTAEITGNETLSVRIRADTTEGVWLNPQGISGRGDRIIDSNGAWIHWIEVQEELT